MNILRFYNNKISSQLSTLDTYLFQLGIYNTDISTINTTSDNLKFYNSKMKLYWTLANNLNTFENIDGMSVSYTHLDVYKRQVCRSPIGQGNAAELVIHLYHNPVLFIVFYHCLLYTSAAYAKAGASICGGKKI